MDIRFLDSEQARQAAIELPDIYYSAGHGKCAQLIDGGQWECAWSAETGHWFPYIKRAIPSAKSNYDLVTPYGYSGIAGDRATLGKFRERFLSVSRERGLVAEFFRSNPFDYQSLKQLDELGVDSWREHQVYFVDREEDPEEYFTQVSGRHRTAVRNSINNGIKIVQAPVSTTIDEDTPFRILYRKTMDRVGASERLKLGNRYFEILSQLGDDTVALLEAHDEAGEVLAASLFFLWNGRVHYHLSGSTTSTKIPVVNLIIDHAVRHLTPVGGALNLGGGLTLNDGLSKFKQSMATSVRPIFLGSNIVDRQRYDELCSPRQKAQTDYFPAYRATV